MNRLLLILALLLATTPFAFGQNSDFPGVQKAMTPEQLAATGMTKLTPAEREKLDQFIRSYVGVSNKRAAEVAAATAVERAVRQNKVRPPDVTESRMVHDYKGYNSKTIITLENGQKWKPASGDEEPNPTVSRPAVVILRDSFGYKMFIEGARMIRVVRVN
jgi:hypothetical protein